MAWDRGENVGKQWEEGAFGIRSLSLQGITGMKHSREREQDKCHSRRNLAAEEQSSELRVCDH